MKISIFPALQFLVYFLKKEGLHSLQSPFVYQLYQGLQLHRSKNQGNFPHIEAMRDRCLRDNNVMTIADFGAGSRRFTSPRRKISAIARYSCSSQQYALLYQYFCSLTPAHTVIELGTCLGINTCYLAAVAQGTVFTFEGAEALIQKAQKELGDIQKINIVPGNISETLPLFLKQKPQVDFAFIDANHTYKDTLSYFEQLLACAHEGSIIIIGDIHWSSGMHRAWQEIIRSERVRLSMDFYECGVLLFKEGLEKLHYILEY